MEQFLILIVIALISALSSWLQKKRQGEESEWPEAPPPAAPPAGRGGGTPPGKPEPARPRPQIPMPSEWERELRRLFGEEPPPPAPAPAPPPTSPPILARESRPAAPAPAPAPSAPQRPPPVIGVPRPARREREPAPKASPILAPSMLVPKVQESSRAHERVRQLSEGSAERLRKAAESAKGGLGGSGRRASKREADSVLRGAVALIRRPETVRQAITASIILGPPKALEE